MTDNPQRPGHDTCGGRTRSGARCQRPAGWGTDHAGNGRCKLHAGSTPTHQARARHAAAREAVQAFGIPVTTTPERALLDEVNRTAGHVIWLAGRVAELDTAELVWGHRSTVARDTPAGREVTTTYGAGRSEWVTLYQSERRHLADVARSAITSAAAATAAETAADLGRRMANVLGRALAGLPWQDADAVLDRFAAELAADEQARAAGD